MFFLILLAYPVLEIVVFLLVAARVGWTSTLLLALATSFLGTFLLRTQGARGPFARDGFSSQAVENYLYGNLGTLLLILPGFITDVLGAALIFAPTRKALLAAVRRSGVNLYRQANGPFSVFRAYRFGDGFVDPFARSGGSTASPFSNDEPIDVETVRRDDDPRDSAGPTPSDPDEPIDVEFVVRK